MQAMFDPRMHAAPHCRIDFSVQPTCWRLLLVWGLFAFAILGGPPLVAQDPAAQRQAALRRYEESIRPVLHERCIACHGALKQEAGLRLDTAQRALAGANGNPILTPGDAAASALLARVQSTDPDMRMPPEGEPLTALQIESIAAWITAGAPSPEGEPEERDPREHWAFQPPVRPPVPIPNNPDWREHPIDAFLAVEHEKRSLQPLPLANKAIVLRRVSLDLIGLPPTPEEIEAYEQSDAPEAYESIVDRLLQSPRHAERWARHWMDLWRYSDWWGLGEEVRNSHKHMWHWRDWILESLDEDRGYDQMLREMLAADELYPTDRSRLRATGYLARQYFKFNRTSWLDETIEHTSKAMLGMTFNCAKCHDHKYDPWTQEDYYRMRAIFEPYQVRIDRVPGQMDIQRDGIPRAFDCNLQVETYLHRRGDDRNPDKSRAIPPGVPGFLGALPWEVREVALPAQAREPGLLPEIRDSYLAAAEARARAAKERWEALHAQWLAAVAAEAVPQGADATAADATASLAKLESLRQAHRAAQLEWEAATAEARSIEPRYAADLARHQSPSPADLAERVRAAALAERQAQLADALWKQSQAQSALSSGPADQQAALTEKLKAADAAVEASLKQLAAPGDVYRSLRGSEKSLESNVESEESRVKPFPATSTGRRSAFAAWLTDRRNPLTARVAVNHIWMRHFGQPLVPTVFDFGRKGTPPTHPELLDYLAVEFMESGWSMKHLHRLIVTSRAYRISSSIADAPPANLANDPDNRFLWRRPTQRMEAQVVRDSLLFLAGTLDLTWGGPSVPTQDEGSRRRSLYFFQSHNEHHKFLSMFDDANVLDCYRRAESIVPQQALALENSSLVQACTEGTVRQWTESRSEMSDAEFATLAFTRILGTRPGELEQQAMMRAMGQWRASASARSVDAQGFARQGLVRALFNHNDFVTIR